MASAGGLLIGLGRAARCGDLVFCAAQSLVKGMNLWERHCRDGVGWWWH
jgi:hypothetical protein